MLVCESPLYGSFALRMACFYSKKSGFTLLEVSLAILIALILMAVAIPSLTGALGESKDHNVFLAFDAMAQEARSRSLEEQRNYVIVWGRDRAVLMRPETPAGPDEAEGLCRWKIEKQEALELHLPAALTDKGMTPDAIWTFWANGICEPAEIRYKGAAGKWSAVYNPFTVQAEVRYE